MTFLVNPRGKRRRATGRGAQRQTKRPPPKGWASWRAYMASIRPGATKAGASHSSEGSKSMARKRTTKKRHTRRRAVTRAHAPKAAHHTRRRRHTRRNPVGVRARSIGAALKNLPAFALHSGIKAGGALAGVVAARKLRGLTGQKAGSMVGSLIEAGVGIVGGALVSTVSPSLGEGIAVGGVLAPLMTFVQNQKIPHISDSLGDDGYLIGGDTGVTLVSAYPDDYAGVGRYANPAPPRLVAVVDDAKHDTRYASK